MAKNKLAEAKQSEGSQNTKDVVDEADDETKQTEDVGAHVEDGDVAREIDKLDIESTKTQKTRSKPKRKTTRKRVNDEAADESDDEDEDSSVEEIVSVGEPPKLEDPCGTRIYNKPASKLTARELGEEGERMAAVYLARHGYEIIEQNWRCCFGEVDIIAKDGDVYVLVEVKTRLALNDNSEAIPELSVNRKKINTYNQLGLMYLAYHLGVEVIRFDVIAINVVSDNCAKLRHLVAAFTLESPC